MTTMVNEKLAEYLSDAQKMFIFTGAGISTGSGIPDFRGPNGGWKKFKPVYYQEFISSEESRIRHWQYKLESREKFEKAEPNAVHKSIADLDDNGRVLAVVTENIDGLHRQAGTSEDRLIELHGNNNRIECQTCLQRSEPEPHFKNFEKTGLPPECEYGGFLKPATISFGQGLRNRDVQRAVAATLEADLVVALGTSLYVHPAASLTLLAAHRGVPYVIINRGETDHDGKTVVSLRIEGDVEEIFPPVVQAALSQL